MSVSSSSTHQPAPPYTESRPTSRGHETITTTNMPGQQTSPPSPPHKPQHSQQQSPASLLKGAACPVPLKPFRFTHLSTPTVFIPDSSSPPSSPPPRFTEFVEHSTDQIVFQALPPSPIQFKHTLDSFWPTPLPHLWSAHPYHLSLITAVRDTALPNYLKTRMPVPSALRITNWRTSLKGYHDIRLPDFLAFGWPVDYTAPFPPTPTFTNHASDPDSQFHIDKYISEELLHGSLIGPFSSPPFTPWSQVSPIMTRPKKDTTAKRIVVDLSFPPGKGVNAGIQRFHYQGSPISLSLPTITNLSELLVSHGSGSYMWTIDLARAYRQLRTCPLSTPLLGIQNNNKFYVDFSPPFGCRTSAYFCARTTAAVQWLLEKKGVVLLCYLDDFIGIAPTLQKALLDYNSALALLDFLGLATSPSKCHPPSTSLTWLGFHVDSKAMTVSIPDTKLSSVLLQSAEWLNRTTSSRKQLQSLVGKLKHISSCLPHANKFFARILAALRNTPFTGQHPVPSPLRQDVNWFLQYATSSNGIFLLPPKLKSHWVIECDSSLRGGGAHSPSKFFAEPYPPSLTDKHLPIAHLESLNLLHAFFHLLPPDPHNYTIIINTDNLPSQQTLMSGKGRDPLIAAVGRHLWLLGALHSTDLRVVHKPGSELILADQLSRFHKEETKAKALRTCKDKALQRISIVHSLDFLNTDI